MNFSYRKDFQEKGYFIIKNLLNKDEITKYLSSIEDKRKSLIIQGAAKFENEDYKVFSSDTSKFKNYSEYDDKRMWEYISNFKLINKITDLIGEKPYFLHDLSLLDPGSNPKNDTSWHRDSPCRTTGIGPDWDQKFKYNVVTSITYLRDSDECGTGLSVIPGSHKISYKKTLSNILRFIHLKTKNNSKLKMIRNLISKMIGTNIKYDAGDCIVFLCTLYHAPITIGNSKSGIKRQCITARYGGKGKHSDNYIDYVTNKRPELNKYLNSKHKADFLNFIKEKEIYLPFVENSNQIQGAFIKKK